MKIRDVFTAEDINQARYYCQTQRTPNSVIRKHLVRPKIRRLNKLTGFDNDAKYWAFMLEYLTSMPTEVALDQELIRRGYE